MEPFSDDAADSADPNSLGRQDRQAAEAEGHTNKIHRYAMLRGDALRELNPSVEIDHTTKTSPRACVASVHDRLRTTCFILMA